MSFSTEVKNELARVLSENTCCQVAELTALMRMGGTVRIGGNRNLGVNFVTENAAVARKALSLLKQGFKLRTELVVTRGRRLKKQNSYQLKVMPAPVVTELLAVLGIMQGDNINPGRDTAILRRACCRRAYLRGAFLGGGSVNRPAGEYHLELVTGNSEFAGTLLRMMKYFKLPARITDRKNDNIIYIKDGEAVSAFLNIIGAHNALMEFENVRIMKEMRNQVNRLVNCETANLQKTVNAAVRQVERIKLIERRKGLNHLPRSLRLAAEARLAYPEATLQELAVIMGDGIGRSGINHRLRRLEHIARELEEEEDNNEPNK